MGAKGGEPVIVNLKNGGEPVMAIDFLYPQYEVVRNNDRCINCRACERQCAKTKYTFGTPTTTACRRTRSSA